MRLLILLFSLFEVFGSQVLAQTSLQTQNTDQEIPKLLSRPKIEANKESTETLESLGFYPVFSYRGRPFPLKEMVKFKESWQGIRPVEEVEWLPQWELNSWHRESKLLLVTDGDGTIYATYKLDGFKPVGYIKKKGVMKRTFGVVKKTFGIMLDGPLHIIFGVFGI